MKKIRTLSICFLLLAACRKSEPMPEAVPIEPERYTTESIDAFIREEVNRTESFLWNTASDIMVWSALLETDSILSVGYRPSNESDVESRLAVIDIKSDQWLSAKNQVLKLILLEERKLNPYLELTDILVWDDDVLPVMNIRVLNASTIHALRLSSLIRYAEPMAYEPQDIEAKIANDSGCGSNTPASGLQTGLDYTSLIPGSKESWNFKHHQISKAWNKSTGIGVKVFFIDSGSSFAQDNLGAGFNQGFSMSRTVEKISTIPRTIFFGISSSSVESPDDACGHGTSMAGVCAAPRGTDGAACGVAYNCNLITCRASQDVFINNSREVRGVTKAYTTAANKMDVKIISMSLGRITYSSQIADAINYAYGKGKLIFCAAGTSFSWTSGWAGVIFPASMSQVSAVTGVRESNYQGTCKTCHNGSETDFTIVMEKETGIRYPLSLAMSGDIPSSVGGSSVATATMAGIAALVWSRFPQYSRSQVLQKLITSSANYPVRNANLGWGNVNADIATN